MFFRKNLILIPDERKGYTQLVQFENDEFHSAVAKTIEEARQLVEGGFDYVTDIEGVKLFRKRK